MAIESAGREPVVDLTERIHSVRGLRVMLDSDLAAINGVTTKRLNEQIKRNLKRFPADFAFVLTAQEFENLKSQNATSSFSHGLLVKKVACHDDSIAEIISAIRELVNPPEPTVPKREIGFHVKNSRNKI